MRMKYINFCGGEPFMSPQTWEILDRLSRLPIDVIEKIHLNFDTNLSFPGNTFSKAFSYLIKFPNLKIQASLDGTGEIGEYVREGLDYSSFIENLKTLKASSIEVWLQHTVTSIGLQDLHNIVKVCNHHEIPFIGRKIYHHDKNFFLNPDVVTPTHFEECLSHALSCSQGRIVETQFLNLTKYLRSVYVPCKLNKASLIESEKTYGGEGFFESKMTGYLNE